MSSISRMNQEALELLQSSGVDFAFIQAQMDLAETDLKRFQILRV